MTLLAKTMACIERAINMENDNLLGAAVRIRHGWHGGRTGKVIVFNQHRGITSSYIEIKVQLDGSGQVINISSQEGLDKLDQLPVELTIQ
jgi:hypothetical protein